MAVLLNGAALGSSTGYPHAEDTHWHSFFLVDVNKGGEAVFWVRWVWFWPQTWRGLLASGQHCREAQDLQSPKKVTANASEVQTHSLLQPLFWGLSMELTGASSSHHSPHRLPPPMADFPSPRQEKRGQHDADYTRKTWKMNWVFLFPS